MWIDESLVSASEDQQVVNLTNRIPKSIVHRLVLVTVYLFFPMWTHPY